MRLTRQRGEEDGEDAEEDVGRAHDDGWLLLVMTRVEV